MWCERVSLLALDFCSSKIICSLYEKNSILQPLCLVLDFEWIISFFSYSFSPVSTENSSNFLLLIRIRNNNIRRKRFHWITNPNRVTLKRNSHWYAEIIINHIHIRVVAYIFFSTNFRLSKSIPPLQWNIDWCDRTDVTNNGNREQKTHWLQFYWFDTHTHNTTTP